jgi:hypothetical protein
MALELQATAIASSTVSIAALVQLGPPVSIRRQQSRFAACSLDHIAGTSIDNGDKMKLVRFDDWKTGLLVQLPIGLRVIDVVESLGALSFEAPISGVLNGILKDRGSWGPLIEHWGQASVGLRRLALLAAVGPGNSRLVIRRLDEIHFGSSSVSSNDVAALEITELCEVAHDPTWREAMLRQPALPPRADEWIDGRVVSLDAHRRLKSDASTSARRP